MQDRNIQLKSSSITCSYYCFLCLLLSGARLRLFSVDQQSNCSSPAVFQNFRWVDLFDSPCHLPLGRATSAIHIGFFLSFFLSFLIGFVCRQYTISLILSCHASYCRSKQRLVLFQFDTSMCGTCRPVDREVQRRDQRGIRFLKFATQGRESELRPWRPSLRC
jgi:hypothetical protein